MKTDFVEFLEELNDGAFRKQLGNWLYRVSNNVNVTGAKGELKLTFKMAPVKDADNVIKLTASVAMKDPKNKLDTLSDSVSDEFTMFIEEDKSVTLNPNDIGDFNYE